MGMSARKSSKVIPLSRIQKKIKDLESSQPKNAASQGSAGEQTPSLHSDAAFLYTLDLLMEDFGKKHLRQNCVLCEPMKNFGLHRDEAIVHLGEALFTTFFPSFRDYVSEMQETLLHGLLDRRERGSFKSWQDKLKNLFRQKIAEDLKDFLEDIYKHLLKHAGVSIDSARREQIFQKTLACLEKGWIRGEVSSPLTSRPSD